MSETIYPVFVLLDVPKDYIFFAAKKLLQNCLIINPRFQEEVKYDIEEFPWEIEFSNSPATYSLYLHALNPVFYLLRAYQFSGNKEYYNLAKKIIISWMKYSEGKARVKTNMMWYDHAVASRIEVFIYFAAMSQEIDGGMELHLKGLIDEHIIWNIDEKNYTTNHNHGIMQDLSILHGGYFLKNTSYVELAVNRLKKQIKYAFPNNIAHSENSIGYHFLAFIWLIKIEKLMKVIDESYSNDLLDLICKSGEFLAWVISPKGDFPPYGNVFRDKPVEYRTEFIRLSAHITENEIEMLYYSNSKGENGFKPQGNHKLFLRDGYSFIRSSWEKEGFENTLFILFKAGFSTLTHKHQDDLSLLLYGKGKEIFVDPGMYNYTMGNVYSDYLNSAFAHNTLLVDEKSFPRGSDLTHKVGMMPSIVEEAYIITRAFNNLYQGVYIDRNIVYLNENKFYIVDDFTSDEVHKYTQNFHLANDIEIVGHSLDYTLLKIRETKWYLLIQQIEEIESVTHKYGNTGSINTMSIIGAGLNSFVDSYTIQYHINGRESRFLTEFSFIKERDLNKAIACKAFVKDDLLITSEGIEIDIQPRLRALPSNVDVNINGSILSVCNSFNKKNNKKSIFYLINRKDLSTHKVEVNDEHRADFLLEEGEDYLLSCYSIDSTGQRSLWKAGYVDSNEGCNFIYSSIKLNESIPYVTHLRVIKIKGKDRQYRFSIETIGFSMIRIKWYIYRNGMSYEFKESYGIQEMDYNFVEQGVYSVILRVYDKFQKEVFFGNFQEIEINE